jgi:hypothetical protein
LTMDCRVKPGNDRSSGIDVERDVEVRRGMGEGAG